MVRTDEQYFVDIRQAIRNYYRPGDQLRLDRLYREARKCQMCGGMVDILNCYDLRNVRTGEVMVCGERCIARYAEVIAQMGETPSIVFPHQYREKAERVNRHRRDTITVEDEAEPEKSSGNWSLDDLMGQQDGADDPDYEEMLADGLDPDEIDWESHDYE
jgi:hypothetical protein